jgi:ABC-2 type transport system permease protein
MTVQDSEFQAGQTWLNKLPSSLSQVAIIAKYELRNYFRSRRFYILLGITLLMTGGLTVLLAYFGASKVTALGAIGFYEAWWQFVPTFVVVFCAVFFGGDAIAGEFQNKTGYFIIGNPIRRSSIYIGKWLAAFIASLIIMGIYTGAALGNGLYYVGAHFPVQFGEAIGFSLVYLVAALGFTFLFSSLFKSGAYSIVVTFILLLFGFVLIDGLVTEFSGVTEPWYSLYYASQIITNVFTIPFPPHATSVPGSKTTLYVATIPEGLAIMGIYFIITTVLGLFLFERKEFN